MLYYLGNARSEAQREKMVRLEEAGICIFCPEHYALASPPKVPLLSNETWSVVSNDFPYQGTLHHLLLLPHEHVGSKIELSPASRTGYWDILDQLAATYDLTYFGDGTRNGDPRYTGGTIVHLHTHVIVGDPLHKGDRVKLFLSSVPDPIPSSA